MYLYTQFQGVSWPLGYDECKCWIKYGNIPRVWWNRRMWVYLNSMTDNDARINWYCCQSHTKECGSLAGRVSFGPKNDFHSLRCSIVLQMSELLLWTGCMCRFSSFLLEKLFEFKKEKIFIWESGVFVQHIWSTCGLKCMGDFIHFKYKIFRMFWKL